jgi:hypothetical protein
LKSIAWMRCTYSDWKGLEGLCCVAGYVGSVTSNRRIPAKQEDKFVRLRPGEMSNLDYFPAMARLSRDARGQGR